MGRTLLIAVVALGAAGCWADFPSELLTPDGSVDITVDVGGGERSTDSTVDGPRGDSTNDGTGGDTTVDVVSPDTQVSCTPGVFLGCTGPKGFERCASSGKAKVPVDCAPANCSASAMRCDECAPGGQPTCSNNSLRTCSNDGLFVDTQCPAGCAQGACCADGDSDGAGCNDCDDGDSRAKPGQTGYFDTPRSTAGGYDFNCDNNDEPEITGTVNCQKNGSGCKGEGWQGSAPACGQPGNFVTCRRSGGSCFEDSPVQRKQACR